MIKCKLDTPHAILQLFEFTNGLLIFQSPTVRCGREKIYHYFFAANRLTLKFLKGIECNKLFSDLREWNKAQNSFQIAVAKSKSNLLNKCQTRYGREEGRKNIDIKTVQTKSHFGIFLTYMPSNNNDYDIKKNIDAVERCFFPFVVVVVLLFSISNFWLICLLVSQKVWLFSVKPGSNWP